MSRLRFENPFTPYSLVLAIHWDSYNFFASNYIFVWLYLLPESSSIHFIQFYIMLVEFVVAHTFVIKEREEADVALWVFKLLFSGSLGLTNTFWVEKFLYFPNLILDVYVLVSFLDVIDQPSHLNEAFVTIIRQTLVKRITTLILMYPINMLVVFKLMQKLLRALSLVYFLITFLVDLVNIVHTCVLFICVEIFLILLGFWHILTNLID